jgi:hypothetical protein
MHWPRFRLTKCNPSEHATTWDSTTGGGGKGGYKIRVAVGRGLAGLGVVIASGDVAYHAVSPPLPRKGALAARDLVQVPISGNGVKREVRKARPARV